MRPKKTRIIHCAPKKRIFRPKCGKNQKLKEVILNLDEFEAMRLVHLESMDQEEAAKSLKVHRSTVSRMLASAHEKITDALVHIKEIKIEKGCCQWKK
ncbi:MAG: DUF134 domain-containing protein [Deltaproteobacteria bacterium]|nr:DUF134 domain-containing protein [Deltaproteobacteria bacterium]